MVWVIQVLGSDGKWRSARRPDGMPMMYDTKHEALDAMSALDPRNHRVISVRD